MGTTLTVFGVRQYLMSSPRFRFRRRRRWEEAFRKEKMLPRTPRNRCLAAIVLSSMLLYRAMSMSRSAMAPAQIVSSRLNLSFHPEQSYNTCPGCCISQVEIASRLLILPMATWGMS